MSLSMLAAYQPQAADARDMKPSALLLARDPRHPPYFDNLKKYAQRPIGTFHALPIARGKSIFKSNWIRDMGQFYGPICSWPNRRRPPAGSTACSSRPATSRWRRTLAARAFGADQRVLRHQRHLDLEQDRPPGAVRPRRHRARRPQLPQVAPLRHRAGRRAAALRRGLSAHGILDVRRGAAAHDQAGAAGAEGRGQARPRQDGGAHQLHLRRPSSTTRAGSWKSAWRSSPTSIFLWDEAWFGFARFSPFLRRARRWARRRHRARCATRRPAYRQGTELLGTRRSEGARHALLTRSGQGAHRVYLTNSTRCTSRCRRCARAR